MHGNPGIAFRIRFHETAQHLVDGRVHRFLVLHAVLQYGNHALDGLVVVESALDSFHVQREFQELDTNGVAFLVVHPFVASILLRHVQPLDLHGRRNRRLRAICRFYRLARAVPLEKRFHRVCFTDDTAIFALGLRPGKAVRIFRHLGTDFYHGVNFVSVPVAEFSRHRHVGTVVERESFSRSFVEFIDLREADPGFAPVEDITVGVDTRIHVAFLGIVLPRAVEITGDQQRDRKCAEESRNSIHSSA